MKFNLNISTTHSFHSLGTEGASHEYMHPKRDWMLILSIAVLVFLCGVVYIGIDFYAQFVMSPEQSFTEDKVIRYRDTALIETAKKYNDDERMFNTLRLDIPPVLEDLAAESTTASTSEIILENSTPLAEEEAPRYTEGDSILPL